MFTKKIGLRFISLSFVSIGIKESILMFFGLFINPFLDKNSQRNKFQNEVKVLSPNASCFTFSSARGALAACLKASKIGLGDEVLLSAFTCLAVPTAVLSLGASPKYCDINPKTLNVDQDSVLRSLTKKTRAVVIQHTLGSIAETKILKEELKNRGIVLIEDCALSIGSTVEDKYVGSFTDASIFSLELSKTISSGWGGILLVNKKELAMEVENLFQEIQEIGLIKSYRMALQVILSGIFYHPNFYWLGKFFIVVMFKLRLFQPSTPECEEEGEVQDDFISKLPSLLVGLAIFQWNKFHRIIESCSANRRRIRKRLLELGYSSLEDNLEGINPVSPRIPLLVSDRNAFIELFKKNGIEIGTWFDGPLTPLPSESKFEFCKDDFPLASFVSKHIVNLPSHNRLTSRDLTHLEELINIYAKTAPEDKELQEKINSIL